MTKARIAGVGMIPFTKPGESEDWDVMAEKAIRLALADAGVGYEQIQQAYAGYVYADSTAGQSALYRVGCTGIPVVNATVLPVPTVSSPAPAPPVVAQPTASAAHGSMGTAPTRSATPPASPSVSKVRAYALAGGTVTLNLAGDSVQLVTAVPKAGYSVQTWSGTGWLRVDFSSGPQVSSLIASWYLHAPTITVTN